MKEERTLIGTARLHPLQTYGTQLNVSLTDQPRRAFEYFDKDFNTKLTALEVCIVSLEFYRITSRGAH